MTDFAWIDEKDSRGKFFNPANIGFEFKDAVDKERKSVLDEIMWNNDTSLYPTLDPKPSVEQELSKIHEELANLRQSNYELESVNRGQEVIIKKQSKKIVKLEEKLRKEQAKTRNIVQNDHMQKEIDELQQEMNKVKDIVDFKRYANGI